MANQIIEAIEKALADAQVKLQSAAAPDAVEAVRIELIGRKGLLPALSKQMGSVPPEERGATGKAFNSAREQLQNMIDEALSRLSSVADASADSIDLTLPGRRAAVGHKHPVVKVIDECAAYRPGQGGTWITPKMRRAYKEFHRLGRAHSFETFSEKGELIGGLYGVHVGGVFCGESMFFKESCASKFALAGMFEFLKNRDVELIDTQMLTPTLAQFGAEEISRDEYWQILESLREKAVKWHSN